MILNDFYVIATASLVAVSCGILGCFLVLRKMAMVGDAISHAVLPGIVFAFLITGSRGSVTVLIGAASLGLLTTLLIEFFHQKAKLQSDASIGVTFTWLFAIGVILISVFAGQVDLDQDCVLHGEIAYVPLDLWILPSGIVMGPTALYQQLLVLMAISIVVFFAFKELKITTFDPAFASSVGISVSLWHYVLMGLVSVATVASFESVGAILVVALLIVPPATAYLMTSSLTKMIFLTVVIGIFVSAVGYYVASVLDGSISGSMTTVSGGLFAIVFLFRR